MQHIKKFFTYHRETIIALTAALFFVASVRVTYAFFDFSDIGIFIFSIISDLLQVVINFIGSLIAFFMTFFVAIAQYDGFASAPAVTKGWVLIRDIANILIVLSLLVIAFMSAFDSGRYGLTKSLGQLIAVAILVNFSKTITLFAISISQVIMLSFVKSFAKVGQGNLFQILGLDSVFSVASQSSTSTQFAAVAGMLFTIVILIIVLGVIIALSMTLLVRVIVFWFLLVLSPLAIAMYAVPFSKLKQIKEKWTEELVNWLILGPMLAFFIWLTFVSLKGASTVFEDTSQYAKRAQEAQRLGEFAAFDNFTGYIIALGMLLGGLKFSLDIAGTASSVFSKSKEKINRGGQLVARGAMKFGGDTMIGMQRYSEAIAQKLRYKTIKDEKGNVIREEERKGMLGALGRGLGKATEVTGAGIRGASRAGEGIQKFTKEPGSVAQAVYRRVVRAERGAVQSKSAELEQKMVDDYEKKIREQGRSASESKLILEDVKKGGRQDMTAAGLMAEFKIARENGAVQTEDDFLHWIDTINKAAKFGGQKDFVKEFEVAQRKEFFKEGSIFREQDQQYAIEKTIPEHFRSLDHREVFKNTKVYELSLDDYFEKDNDGNLTNIMKSNLTRTQMDAFERKKVAMLSYDENSIALSDNMKSKGALRGHLERLKQTGRLTGEELNKANRLIAATAINGTQAQKYDGSINTEIDNLTNGKDSTIRSTSIDLNDLQDILKVGKELATEKVETTEELANQKVERTPDELASYIIASRPKISDIDVFHEVEKRTGQRISISKIAQIRANQKAAQARRRLFEEASQSSEINSAMKILDALTKDSRVTVADLGGDINDKNFLMQLDDEFKQFMVEKKAAQSIQDIITNDLKKVATQPAKNQEAELKRILNKVKELAQKSGVSINYTTGLSQLEGHLQDLIEKRGRGGAAFEDQVNRTIENITSGSYVDIAPDIKTVQELEELVQQSVARISRETDPNVILDTLKGLVKDAQTMSFASTDESKANELINRIRSIRAQIEAAARLDPTRIKEIINTLVKSL